MAVALYQSDRGLSTAVFGDLDGDGLVDVVATSSVDQNLDVLYRHANPDTFERTRQATDAVPHAITIGDFDGDGIADVVFAQAAGTGEQIVAAFGSPLRQLSIVAVAQLDQIVAMTRGKILDSGNLRGLVDSIGVVELRVDPRDPTRATRNPVLELFHGSSQRDFVPYLDPRAPCLNLSFSRFTGLVGGHFSTRSTALDLLAFDDLSPPLGFCADASDKAWLFVGSGVGIVRRPGAPNGPSGRIDFAPGTAVDPGVSCIVPTAFCPAKAQFTTWPSPSTPGLDAVIGIDASNGHVVVIDPGDPKFAFPQAMPQVVAGAAIAGQPIAAAGSHDPGRATRRGRR
jgi:hypothetical protein